MAQRGIVAAGGWGMSWTATPRLAPDVQPWLARVFDVRERTPNVVGAGFLVDEQHVVTCAHVVLAALGAGERDPLPPGEVGVPLDFPAADGEPVWATVDRDAWRPVDADGRGDVAVLQLSSPLPAIEPAPLRAPTALRDHTFSTHGFPPGEPWGVTAVGVLRGREGPGWQWVRVENTGFVGRPVERGFSGAPVWDDQLGAVVGMVVAQDRRREARGAYAIPVAVLAQAWPLATLAVPGSNAEELEKHWAPRSRGVKSLTPTTGWYFTGRRQALRELVGWLTAPSDEQPRGRVVSGGPGSGQHGR